MHPYSTRQMMDGRGFPVLVAAATPLVAGGRSSVISMSSSASLLSTSRSVIAMAPVRCLTNLTLDTRLMHLEPQDHGKCCWLPAIITF